MFYIYPMFITNLRRASASFDLRRQESSCDVRISGTVVLDQWNQWKTFKNTQYL